MPMKVTGAGNVIAQLRYAQEKVPEVGRKTMHRIADSIVKDAQLFTPVDKHNLEKSIHKEVNYGDKRRLQIDIMAGGMVDGVNVDEYIKRIHENYEDMISKNGPGAGTQVKRAMNPGVYIGEKFLTRAINKHKKRATEIVSVAVFKVVNNAN